MKIGGMGGLEIVIILVVILIIFGPKNLPKLGNAIGKTISNLREGMGAGKKKAEENKAEASEKASDGDEAPVEIEGEIAETVVDTDEDTKASDGEPAKKVRRVVKKVPLSEVVTEETTEVEETTEATK